MLGRTRRYVTTMRAFRPCASCGQCPIWWNNPATYGCQQKVGPSCTAVQCNRTVRAIGASVSASGDFARTSWGLNEEVHADHDDPTQQFYSQVSWPFYNIYLGIVMVFAAGDPPDVYGKVCCARPTCPLTRGSLRSYLGGDGRHLFAARGWCVALGHTRAPRLPQGKVHCELAWSADGTRYERLSPGADFLPHGDEAARGQRFGLGLHARPHDADT